MAGKERPKCSLCGTYYKYEWHSDTFKKNCSCGENKELLWYEKDEIGR